MQSVRAKTPSVRKHVNIDALIPPESMVFTGSPDFKVVGNEFFKYFVTLAGLQPHHRVLDVGCGLGRMALPLTQYLTDDGGYEGFDIVPAGIDWCREKITPLFPNFRFQLADIYNKYYNPTGRYQSAQYRFPYPDRAFDFVFLASVFTHMLPAEVENYLAEIARVMKRGGRCLISMFLLNEESLRLIKAQKSHQNFQFELGARCRVTSQEVPEASISYDEAYALDLFSRNGLAVESPIHYGVWCGRPSWLSYQDIVVATKTGGAWLGRLAALFRRSAAG
jgi:SAM-dependent methyltransferase